MRSTYKFGNIVQTVENIRRNESGRNYPNEYELVDLVNQFITRMLGNSIAE